MEIKLEINNIDKHFYSWNKSNYCYYISNNHLDIEHCAFDSLEQILDYVTSIEQSFSLIIHHEDFLFACVDAISAFPLFYKINTHEINITNNILRNENDIINTKQVEFFKQHFCTENKNTLINSWKRLQIGEYFYYNKKENTYKIDSYLSIIKNKYSKNNTINFYDLLLKKVEKLKQQFYDYTFVVPLSGGYDSRAVLCLLKDAGVQNIFTYTYGNINSEEKKIAEEVAKKLDVPWLFIEYDENLLQLFFTDVWKDYALNNHHFTSLPHEQDFFALHYLRQQQIVPHQSIFFPGFIGDYYAGSMFKDEHAIKYYSKELNQDYIFWYLNNRASKFIVNAVRSFEYFGYQWQLILYDIQLINYFFLQQKDTTFSQYEDLIFNNLFKNHCVDFKKSKPANIKHYLKKITPKKILQTYQKYNSTSIKNDPINANLISKKMTIFDTTLKQHKFRNFNNIHAIYFLKSIHIS
jgi:asparagine synthase (glutamine-hydrolysing)